MLHFNGLEPIDFKGHECEPKIDAEKKLRLSAIKFDTAEDIRYADEVLATCFDDEFAKNFIREKLSVDDKVVLKTYLVSGETGLNRLSDVTNGAIEKYINRALEGINEKE
ncbi:hypothetical protein [Fibrobacter sp.]|uniref:hypothetical protein n=1 Tax=Fibrobacter sp. TaxID=35828 RepID=UPI00389029B4